MRYRPFETYLKITIKDMVSSIMVAQDTTTVRMGEVYDFYLELTHKIKQSNIYGEVFYSRDYLKEFKYENQNEFNCGVGFIALKEGYTIDWLQQNVVSHMSNKKLQLLGLIEQEQDYSV